jgi:hypothetical protein
VLPDTKAIADAAARLNTPGSCQMASAAFAAPNGQVWLVAKDRGYMYVDGFLNCSESRNRLTCRLIDRRGVQVGRDIPISIPGEPAVTNACPLEVLYDRSLVLACRFDKRSGRTRLVRIDSTGVVAVSGPVPDYTLHWDAVIDRQGLLHVAGPRRGVDYMQINTLSPGMPTVRQLKYSDRFGPVDSAPFWMRWKGDNEGLTNAFACCDEDSSRLVVATIAQSDSFIRLCRFNTKTLEVLDSGLVYRGRDVHHAIQDNTLGGLTLVHSDSGGFWLFLPGGMSPDHPRAVRVYRLSHDLATLHSGAVWRDSVRPFSQAPEGSLLDYRLFPQLSKERYSKSGYSLSGTFGLYFTACGSDGRLYETQEERSAKLEVLKPGADDSLGRK